MIVNRNSPAILIMDFRFEVYLIFHILEQIPERN